MSVKLRMARLGRHNDPYFRIVAADSRYASDGRYIEQIGRFNPTTGKAEINEELAMKWLKSGAQPSDSIKTLLTGLGLIAKYNASKGPSHKKSKTIKKNKFDRPAKPKVKKVKPAPAPKAEAKPAEAPKAEAPKADAPATPATENKEAK
ncbi:MAG: 30S ribosomal protein S16 [Bacilli bacterium]|nr:30S ribosomal protein S16 [Bacilli bacterium]